MAEVNGVDWPQPYRDHSSRIATLGSRRLAPAVMDSHFFLIIFFGMLHNTSALRRGEEARLVSVEK